MNGLEGYEPGEIEAATLAGRLENGIIPHPALKQASAALRLHQLRSLPLDGNAPRPGHLLLLTGAPGAGKSTVLKLHKARFPDVRDEDGLRITAILAEMPAPCTKRGVVEAIFRSMGHDAPADWNSARIVEEIANLVQRHHVLMIMLDEADRMMGGETDAVAKFLVSLLNTVKAQMVLAGATDLLALNTGYGLERRTQEDVVLTPYRWDTGEGQTSFRSLLGVFGMRLGVATPVALGEFHLARRIYVATGGHVGIVSKLLVAASRHAAGSGGVVDRGLLGTVWADLRRKDEDEQEIDFDRDVEKNPVKPRPRLKAADNPFLCKDARVVEIWKEHRAATVIAAEAAEAARRGKRRLRARGSAAG